MRSGLPQGEPEVLPLLRGEAVQHKGDAQIRQQWADASARVEELFLDRCRREIIKNYNPCEPHQSMIDDPFGNIRLVLAIHGNHDLGKSWFDVCTRTWGIDQAHLDLI